MTITIDQMVAREVHYCVSALVSTLASNFGLAGDFNSRDMTEATEQAFELASPILDYEEAAIQAGASLKGDMWEDEDGHAESDAQEMCEWLGIEPCEREVFEHWIVSNWLAEKLQEHGEKVDTDFCGMTVWARTTTGQGIASDSVIKRIYAELVSGS